MRWQPVTGGIAPVLVLLGAALFARHALDQAIATTSKIDNLSVIIGDANALMKTVVDAETGQRGFLATKDPRFLEPYEQALSSFGNQLDALKRLVADDPAQAARLAEIGSSFEDWRGAVAVPSIQDPVVVDIRLPGRSGLDILPELRAVRPSASVIVLSGRSPPRRCLRLSHQGVYCRGAGPDGSTSSS